MIFYVCTYEYKIETENLITLYLNQSYCTIYNDSAINGYNIGTPETGCSDFRIKSSEGATVSNET